jgi:hypothetical protein
MAVRRKKLNRKGPEKKKRKSVSKKPVKRSSAKVSSPKVKSKKRAGGKKSVTRAKKKKPVSARATRTAKKASKASSRKVASSGRPRRAKVSARRTKRKAKVGTRVAKPRKISAKVHVRKRALTRKKPAKGHISPIKPPFEAYRGIRPFLFVSYSHRNMRDVFRILKRLYDNRYRIWYDEGIEPGNEWPEVVGKAIVNCSQYLVFMSHSAAISRNVRNEVNLASTENKEIIVVNLEETRLTSGMKLQIGTFQHINRYEMGEKEFYEKLFKVLKSELRS